MDHAGRMNAFSTFAISSTLIVLAASVGPGCGQGGGGVAATGASSSSGGQGGSAGAPASSSSGQGGSAAAPASSSSGQAGGAGGQGGAAGAPASSSSGQGGTGGGGECPPVQVACTTWNVYQCGDGIDNDADGL